MLPQGFAGNRVKVVHLLGGWVGSFGPSFWQTAVGHLLLFPRGRRFRERNISFAIRLILQKRISLGGKIYCDGLWFGFCLCWALPCRFPRNRIIIIDLLGGWIGSLGPSLRQTFKDFWRNIRSCCCRLWNDIGCLFGKKMFFLCRKCGDVRWFLSIRLCRNSGICRWWYFLFDHIIIIIIVIVVVIH